MSQCILYSMQYKILWNNIISILHQHLFIFFHPSYTLLALHLQPLSMLTKKHTHTHTAAWCIRSLLTSLLQFLKMLSVTAPTHWHAYTLIEIHWHVHIVHFWEYAHGLTDPIQILSSWSHITVKFEKIWKNTVHTNKALILQMSLWRQSANTLRILISLSPHASPFIALVMCHNLMPNTHNSTSTHDK